MKEYRVIVGPMENNCFIVASEQKNCVIIDPGFESEKILEVVKQNNLTVKHIMITHGHYDHTSASGVLKKTTNATIMMSKEDFDTMTNEGKSGLAFEFRNLEEDYQVDNFIQDGDEVVLDELKFKIVSTSGHSKGGLCFVIDDVIYCGDTLFKNCYGRTDLYGGDYAQLKASVKKLANLSGDYKLKCGHGPDTTLSYEKKYNEIFW